MTVTQGEIGQNAPTCSCGSPAGWTVTATVELFPRRRRSFIVTPCEDHLRQSMREAVDFTTRCAGRGRKAGADVRPLRRAA